MNILCKYKFFDFRLLWDDLKDCTYTYHIDHRASRHNCREHFIVLIVDYKNYRTICTVTFEMFLDGHYHLKELKCPDNFQCKKYYCNKDIILLNEHIDFLKDKVPFKDLKFF